MYLGATHFELKMNRKIEQYVLDAQIGFQLRLAYQKSCAIFSLAVPGLTPTQWAVIAKLHELGECSQNLLGRETGMDTSTIKGVVTRLLSRNIIEILPDESDRRRVSICLTSEGQQLYGRYSGAALLVGEHTMSGLSEGEKRVFRDLLNKLVVTTGEGD